MTCHRSGWIFVVAVGLMATLSAQTPDPTFEVASVKPNKSGEQKSASFVQPGGRYTATNVTLRMLLRSAYGVHDTQIVGGPNWVNTDRFDIAAQASDAMPPTAFRDQARLMLRPLLAERFKLELHHESREIPVYGLVLARGNGAFGPQFRRSDGSDCDVTDKSLPADPSAAEPSPPLPCGGGFSRSGHIAGRRMELAALVSSVSSWADRVILDRTALIGTFDWDLQWTQAPLTADVGADPSGLSLFTAIQEQLGLKLESRRSPVDVLVIDSVQQPTEN